MKLRVLVFMNALAVALSLAIVNYYFQHKLIDMLLTFSVALVVSYVSFYYLIERFVYSKIKLIYKLIHNLKLGKDLKDAGKVKYAIAINAGPLYNALPIWTSYGGYVFGKTDKGAWNPQDVGIDSKGFIDGVAWVRKGVTDGLIPETLDSAAAAAMFENGEIPFYMDGPWDLDPIRKSGVHYAVATSFPGNGAPFSGVQGFFVNPYSKNVLLAQTFLTDYIATDAVMQQLADTGNRPSAFTSILDKTTDPDLKAM